MNEQVIQIKQDLAKAYQFIAMLGMDDLTYTHLSARHPTMDAFFINPFGMLFEEVTSENLILIDFDGNVVGENAVNKTGFKIHGSVYRARPEIMASFHIHTAAGIAVSNLTEGLLPLSQFSYHFYERVGYHRYNGLALDDKEGAVLGESLGDNMALFLRTHGTLTVGKTIQEAFFYTYYLEQACRAQVQTLSQGREVILTDPETCRRARDQMRNFEPDLGRRDWEALCRKLGR